MQGLAIGQSIAARSGNGYKPASRQRAKNGGYLEEQLRPFSFLEEHVTMLRVGDCLLSPLRPPLGIRGQGGERAPIEVLLKLSAVG